jgi:hypothetical protein
VSLPKLRRGESKSRLQSVMINRDVAALAGVLALLATWAAQVPAGATSPKSLARDLLASSYAKADGFTKVVARASTTAKTGVKNCQDGGKEAFETASGQTGLLSEVVACTTSKAVLALLSGTRSATSASSASPPARLGPSAMERSNGSTYAIYWRRGALVEMVALVTNVSASSSSSTSTTVAAAPITLAQQALLSNAAVEQNALIK